MKHGWNHKKNYFDVHEKVLRTFHRYMVAPKNYSPPIMKTPDGQWLFFECRGIQLQTLAANIVHVKIEKDVEVDLTQPKRPLVRTMAYSYHANKPDGTQLIRYCSPDLDYATFTTRPSNNHHGYHHLHDFTSGREVVTQIAGDDWPHVGEFLTEVRQKF